MQDPVDEAMDYLHLETPIGKLLIAGDDKAVRQIHFQHSNQPRPGWQPARAGPVVVASRQLGEYFSRKRRAFDVPLTLEGTPFQKRVWGELTKIPYGQTISYGELAQSVGDAGASRAVGAANGANPIPLIIPCHRVIGANGKLTGFGGGLPVKKALLALEAGQTAVAL